MAEFCLDCWNKINEIESSERKYILSQELDLCEECSEWKHVVITECGYNYTHKSRIFKKCRFIKKKLR